VKFSIVTISFNQARFLEQAIRSVIEQDYSDIEYIVVDPGSTDGSREIIERYRDRITKVIFEPDNGPADGLNKGFSVATGNIFGFLNSDDILLPNAIQKVAKFIRQHPDLDVISGHSVVLDAEGKIIRISHSDLFSLRSVAYGGCVLMQPSTFFKRDTYRLCKGFNVGNRSNWDGELFVDMALNGARYGLIKENLSGYRVHLNSVTGSKSSDVLIKNYGVRIFKKIIGRDKRVYDKVLSFGYRIAKYVRNPAGLYQRIIYGPVYGNVTSKSYFKRTCG
jgi:glycosyltransferase involved in cell wall biosynthesis